MISTLLALTIVTAAPDSGSVPAPIVGSPDPAPQIRISLNAEGDYERGDRARVRVRAAADGYLVVLRADVAGRVRVLFPLDPGDDDFVRGGREYELRGRGDRSETFIVDDERGRGLILAAHSPNPFQYDRFVRGDHWDYRALASDLVRSDPEAGLLDLVAQMAGPDSAHFDYDIVTYTVGDYDRLYTRRHWGGCYGCGWYGPRWGIGIGVVFGRPYYRYCDPFLYDPFFCNSIFYDPFYYPYYYSYSYRYRWPYRYSCFGDPFCFGYNRTYYSPGRTYAGGFTFKRPAPPPPLVLPRRRIPDSPIVRETTVRRRGDRGGTVDWGRRAEPRRAEPRRAEPRREVDRGRDRPSRSAAPRERGSQWAPRERPSASAAPRAPSPSRASGSRPANSTRRRN